MSDEGKPGLRVRVEDFFCDVAWWVWESPVIGVLALAGIPFFCGLVLGSELA